MMTTMPDPPMSAMEVRLERVHRAVPLDRAISRMASRYADTCAKFMAAAAAAPPAGSPEVSRLGRAATRQHLAFLRLLSALTRLAESTDADLQRSDTRR